MSVKLITYDLNKAGQDYSSLLKEIKTFPWARLSESSYAVYTELTPGQLYDRLRPLIDANDNLFVIPLHRPYQGWGPRDVHEWLDRYLTYAAVGV